MKEIATIAELRSIQLAVLDHITTYCDKHGIVYFLACGSLIGAIRHKGYIPWDDDIDLFMPRESYNRLLAAYRDPDPRYACLLRDARSTTSTPMPRLSTAARSLSKTRCRATSWACMSTSFRSTM